MPVLDIDGKRVNYVRSRPESPGADRPPLVFVHGFACALSDWRLQRRSLGYEFETVACDLPGHGDSGPSDAPPSITGCARAVAAVLDALELEPAVLVGHSMGCRVVMQTRMEAPGRVAGLVLVDGSWLGRGEAETARANTRAAMMSAGYEAVSGRLFEEMFLPGASEALSVPIVKRATALPAELGADLFADLAAWDAGRMAETLPALDVPLAAIQSTCLNENRERRPLRIGQSTPWLDLLREKVPAARIEIVPHVGHFPMLEAPGAVNRVVRELAETLRTAA